jgi:uncharacterized membrane protein
MELKRILKHWRLSPWQLRQRFGQATLAAIADAIAASEQRHRGELRFVIEGRLSLPQLLRGLTARERAAQLFDRLAIGNTAEHSGILIYVLLAERQVEILADRGIAARVAQEQWDALCAHMTRQFAAGRYRAGALEGIEGATRLLDEHFPARAKNPDELDNAPLIL